MEKGKTAMQILYDEMKTNCYEDGDSGFVGRSVVRIIEERNLLELTKEQIIISYTRGMNEILRDRKSKFNGSDYFEQKFGGNE